MNFIKINKLFFQFSAVALVSVFFAGCDPDDPEKEDTPELITKVTLTFTPEGGGMAVIATATDPDGLGVQPLVINGPIELEKNKTYTLNISLLNELAASTAPEYNITAEVEEEGDEHMFFFSWTNSVFSNPDGNGNVDNRADPVNYEDEDVNGLPLGLQTLWHSADVASSGDFRIMLKHQPELKSATSDSEAGDTDVDVIFDIEIK
jgi:hypothetical protein